MEMRFGAKSTPKSSIYLVVFLVFCKGPDPNPKIPFSAKHAVFYNFHFFMKSGNHIYKSGKVQNYVNPAFSCVFACVCERTNTERGSCAGLPRGATVARRNPTPFQNTVSHSMFQGAREGCRPPSLQYAWIDVGRQ